MKAQENLAIDIRGVEGKALENVRAALNPPPGVVDQLWIDRFKKRIPEIVRRSLEPYGYYKAEVDFQLQEVDSGRYRLELNIRPGEPVRIDDIRIELRGGRDSALRRLVEKFPLKKGDPLRQDIYERAKGELLATAQDRGYLNAEFTTRQVRVRLEDMSAEIELVLDTGPRFRFGEVSIEGAPEYPPGFLERYLAFEPGERFSYAKLGQTQLNYLDSDRFKEVIITPREELAEGNTVPVEIRLVSSLPKRLRPGIGFATDTGARVTLRYNDVNIFHLGHELDAEFIIAQLQQSLGVGYIIPSRKNVDSRTEFRVGYDRVELDAFDSTKFFAEAARVRSFGKGREGSVYLRVLQEDFEVGTEDDDSAFLVLPGIRFSRRRYNDPVQPTKGYRFALEARGTNTAIGSDTDLAQLLASGNYIWSLPFRLSLFTRLQTAVTLQSDPLEQIPPSLRFFAGGDQSVRGYAYQSLGPTNDEGDVIGGENLLVGSIELTKRVGEDWGVAVFADAGNAFNNLSDIRLREAVGIGIRRYTVVGPVRVDLARQVGVSDPSFRLHISVGFGF